MSVKATSEPLEIEALFARYMLAYSELEFAVRTIARLAIAAMHSVGPTESELALASSRMRMTDLLTERLGFQALRTQTSAIIEEWANDLEPTARAEVLNKWKRLARHCDQAARTRNKIVHSQLEIDDMERLLATRMVNSLNLNASELSSRTSKLDSLRQDVLLFAFETLRLVHEAAEQ